MQSHCAPRAIRFYFDQCKDVLTSKGICLVEGKFLCHESIKKGDFQRRNHFSSRSMGVSIKLSVGSRQRNSPLGSHIPITETHQLGRTEWYKHLHHIAKPFCCGPLFNLIFTKGEDTLVKLTLVLGPPGNCGFYCELNFSSIYQSLDCLFTTSSCP